MNRLHATLTALAVVCLATPAWATATNYVVLGPTTETFVPLQGGTGLSFTEDGFPDDDDGVAAVDLPGWLNFRFYGVPVSRM